MIQLTVIVSLLVGIVIGFYGIMLLQQMRKKYTNDFLNSFFYYQILTLLFGLYGIAGNLLIREILPKFGVKMSGIETISHFLPLLGLPFLIAGWFLQLKMVAEICNKKISQLVGIIFFLISTGSFLLYGFYILNIKNIENQLIDVVRKNVFLGFVLVELLVVGYMVSYLLLHAIAHKDKIFRIYLSRFAIILASITLLKTASLYFSYIHFSVGIYFILFYFTGSIPLIFLSDRYLKLNFKNATGYLNSIFEKYKITPREKEIIIEICKGKTNQQIADSLFITLQTVKDHTHNIFQKTEVKNRVQLAQIFSELAN